MFLEAAHNLKIFLESCPGNHNGSITAYPLGFVLIEYVPVVKLEFERRLGDLSVINSDVAVIFTGILQIVKLP